MFGSDWPVALLAAEKYASVVDLATALTSGFSTSENEGFWRANVLRSYNITTP
jgi:predicted TIM-barrel fold metal-dependent hydrolase